MSMRKIMYKNVRRLYQDLHTIDESGVQRAVELTWITQEQADKILGKGSEELTPENEGVDTPVQEEPDVQ